VVQVLAAAEFFVDPGEVVCGEGAEQGEFSGEPEGSNAKAFAEIIAAGVLAGELSLLGALAANHLARAHNELGRG